MSAIINADFAILNFIYDNLRCAFLDAVMPLVTMLGESGIFFIIIAIGLLLFKKTRNTGFMLAISLIIGLVVCNLTLKPFVARPRPYTFRTDVVMLVDRLSDYSFPSGHTVAAFECATVFFKRKRYLGLAFLALAIIIAFSRLYLYVHFPTDVLVGAIIGVLSGIIAVNAVDKIYNVKSKGNLSK